MPSTKPATHTKKQTLPKAYCRRKIKALKLPVAQLVEQHGQRHQFRQAQRDWTPPLLLALRQQAFLPFRLERLEKVIDQAIQFRKLSIRCLLVRIG